MKKLAIILLLAILLQAFAFLPEYEPAIGANCSEITGYWYFPGLWDPGYMHLVIVNGYDVQEVILESIVVSPNAFVYRGDYRNAPGAIVEYGWVVSGGVNYPVENLPYDLPNCTIFFPMVEVRS